MSKALSSISFFSSAGLFKYSRNCSSLVGNAVVFPFTTDTLIFSGTGASSTLVVSLGLLLGRDRFPNDLLGCKDDVDAGVGASFASLSTTFILGMESEIWARLENEFLLGSLARARLARSSGKSDLADSARTDEDEFRESDCRRWLVCSSKLK